ncbi:hypothetical protein ACXR2T_10785 [Leucobacter sp. HY1910]
MAKAMRRDPWGEDLDDEDMDAWERAESRDIDARVDAMREERAWRDEE